MTTDDKITACLAGDLTITGREFVVRLAALRANGLGLWAKELEFLDHLFSLQESHG